MPHEVMKIIKDAKDETPPTHQERMTRILEVTDRIYAQLNVIRHHALFALEDHEIEGRPRPKQRDPYPVVKRKRARKAR